MAALAASASAPAMRLRELVMGFRATQLMHVAARLNLADHLRHGARSARELAGVVGADAQALRRVMRALAGLGVLVQHDDETFALAPLGEPLCSDHDDSVHALAVLYGEPWLWQAYGALLQGVRSGRTAFDAVHGQRFFAFLQQHPHAAASFDAAMSGYSRSEAAAIAAAYVDFATMRHVVDVGGGHGALLAALLRRHPRLHATLFDRAVVTDAAHAAIATGDLAPRLHCVAGDFFERVEPAGADAYLLKNVVHDWEDDDALALLRACRAACIAASRLLLVERLLPEPGDAAPPDAVLFDINMLVTVGGRERSAREHAALLQAAGLRVTRVVPTAGVLAIVEAVRA